MKKIYIILLLSFSGIVYSQSTYQAKEIEQGKVTSSTSPDSSHNTYEARDKIRLTNGFRSSDVSQKPFVAKINETMICPVTYQEPVNPDEREIDTSKPVGAIAGSVDVSPTGAATYQIPIAVPPGTAGMEPNISIVYNSQAGNGMLGIGWDIAGLSAVTRTQQTIYHDGQVKPIALTNEDRFILDGNRLMVTNGGGYGNNNTVYGTEQESFSRITSHGAEGTGPKWFKVETKEGMVLEYGNTDDSRMKLSGNNTVFAWRLNKVTDPNGNYMTYTYGQENGESWIKEINYTGNTSASLTPYNKILFQYERREDIDFSYVGNSRVNRTLLLSKIKILSDNNPVKKYYFRYNKDIYSHLQEIVEENGIGEQFNSTIIKWGDKKSFDQNIFEINDNFAQMGARYWGDFNKDGRTDFIAIYSENGEPVSWHLFLASSSSYYYEESSGSLANGFQHMYISHPDSEGFPHIFLLYSESNTYIIREGSFNDQYNLILKNEPVVTAGQGSHSSTMFFKTGDLTGSGSMDYVFSPGMLNNNFRFFFINKGMSFFLTGNFFDTHDVYFIDFDGDGRDEVMITKEMTSEIYSYDSNQDTFIGPIYDSGFPTRYHEIFFGDFNGDGKQDILAYASDADQWHVHFSTGIGFTHDHLNFLRNMAPSKNQVSNVLDHVKIGDVNGDGRSDIVVLNGKKIHVCYGVGNNDFTYKTYDSDESLQPAGSYVSNNADMIDYDGDGRLVLIQKMIRSNSNVMILYRFHTREQIHFVQSIINGFNHKIDIAYSPLSKEGGFYEGVVRPYNHGYKYNIRGIRGALYTVSKIKQPDGKGDFLSTTYNYKGAELHYTGKGFLGFSEITATNDVLGTKQTQCFKYDSAFFHVYLSKLQTSTSNNSLISASSFTTAIKELNNGRYFPYISATEQKDHLKNSIVKTDYCYHENGADLGNLQYMITQYGSVFTDTVKYTYVKPSDCGWYYKNRIERQETVSNHADDNNTYSRFTTYQYDSKGNLKKKLTDIGIVTEYELNNFGLVTKETITAPYYDAQETNLVYDAKKRFLTGVSNELGVVSKMYDVMGNLLSETDATGLTTTHQYDGFGRIVKTIVPEGHTVATSHGWVGEGTSGITGFYEKTDAPGKPSVKTIYDLLGRKIQTEADGFNGTVLTRTTYNRKGQIEEAAYPYYSGENPGTISYKYDRYGRDSVLMDKGKRTTVVYGTGNDSSSVTVTTPDGEESTKYYNAHGNLIKATDNGGDVLYKYHSSGQPKKITTNGAVFEMQYDQYGLQVQLIDPNAGTITYTYDAFGNLKTQKNAKNETTSYLYDKFQRIISKTSSEGTISYSYNASGNGKGQISSVTGLNHSLSYNYGDYGRLVSQTETIAGNTFTHSYDYDRYGNTTGITYPGGFKIKREYNGNGYLTTIRNSLTNQPIWQLSEVTAQGQPKMYSWGRGNTITYNYNSYNLPTSITVSDVQTHTYNISSTTGNMDSRSYGANRTENFYYDNLNRLEKIGRNGQANFAVSYFPNGNIQSKADAGDYAYHEQKVHAVSKIEHPSSLLLGMANQAIDYTSFQKAKEIREGDHKLQLFYGVDNQRMQTKLYANDQLSATKYYSGAYEYEINHTTGATRRISYIHSPFGPVAAYIQSGSAGSGSLYYLATDLLGSITAVVPATGSAIEYRSYDAWGRVRNPYDWSYDNVPAFSIIDRGYTFHEHLPEFGLINMNGRMYDPLVARFLSPDPYVQNPESTQGFNRYSYCLNNPLKYTDPSGEKMKWWGWMLMGLGLLDPVTATTTAATAGATVAGIAVTVGITGYATTVLNSPIFAIVGSAIPGVGADKMVRNSFRLTNGLFATDQNRNFWARTWQFASRFSWEAFQTSVGLSYTQGRTIGGKVDRVDYFGGATFATKENAGKSDGVSLGNYININIRDKINNSFQNRVLSDPLFMHEFGHTFDSRLFGLSYLFAIGIPSLVSATNSKQLDDGSGLWAHDVFWTEMRANKHAKKYFRKFGINWDDFWDYPLSY